jgi:CRP-like cAMP-binding protein
MNLAAAWHAVIARVRAKHHPLPSFHAALQAGGGQAGAVDRGMDSVSVTKIVGSVGRSQNLRSDFFYLTGRAVTQRFLRIEQAMRAGIQLPPIELYKLKSGASPADAGRSEYYVVDGHHRVAMARKLGQEFIDAHIVEYQTRDARLAHTLRSVPLLRDAPATDLAELWKHLTEIRVPAGAIICRRHEPGDRLFIVKAGSVEVRLGVGADGVSLYRLEAGDCFGEMALLTGQPRSADVVALNETTVWSLDRPSFDAVVNQSVPLLRALNRSVAQRLSMATTVIEQTRFSSFQSGPGGLRFGAYRVVAQLGSGGMSVVYSAVREHDSTTVALKVLPAAWGAASELQARLRREAEVLQTIQHPNVIRLLEVGEVSERAGGGSFLALEWVPDALDRVLRVHSPDPLEPRVALMIARGVASGLAAVHAAGMIHRDVKPSNVLLRADGQPVLTDFGLSAALAESQERARLTPPDTLVGTADYLAPEAVLGRTIDGRLDLYALGVVLYEMLAGYVPFAGRDSLQTLRAQVEEHEPALPASIPAGARMVVERALQKDPDKRFSSALEFVQALDAAREN